MGRRFNAKCFACSRLSMEQVYELHGPEGVDEQCWDIDTCRAKRSYWADEGRRAKKLEAQKASRSKQQVPTVELAVPDKVMAFLIIYRETQSSPVHAIGAELWNKDTQLAVQPPKHVHGLTESEIKKALAKALQDFSKIAGTPIESFREIYALKPQYCPIRPCPLHPEISEKVAQDEFPLVTNSSQ